MSKNTATKTADTAAASSLPHEDVNCPFHGMKASLFCEENGCQKNICAICLIRDHNYHDVIAPENEFVYCRDPVIVDSVEKDMVNMLCDQVMGLSITPGMPEVSPGKGSQQPEEEVAEIVYDREMDQKKYLETEHQPEDVSLVKIHHSLIAEYKNICYVSQIQVDNSFVVCGQSAGLWELVRHRLEDGAKLDRVVLRAAPTHAQEVVLNAHLTIAVSYRYKMKIDFHEFKDLSTVSRSYSLDTLQPGILCTSSPSTLLCAAIDENSGEMVLSIDCSLREPTCRGKNHISTFRSSTSMCFLQYQGRALITVDSLGMHAFDLETKQMLWTTGSMLPQWEKAVHLMCVTSNGRGLLFAVDDNNNYVQLFSATNGCYCGRLTRDEGCSYERPVSVKWCENTSTLILVHRKGKLNIISFIKISA